MEPRRLGSSTRSDVCCAATAASSWLRATCQYVSRTTRLEAATTKASSTMSDRRRESVRPSVVVIRRSARGDDERLRQRCEARVDGQLPDCGRLGQAVQIVLEVLGLIPQVLLLRAEPVGLVAELRDPDALRQREERAHEGDDDHAEEQPDPAGPAA